MRSIHRLIASDCCAHTMAVAMHFELLHCMVFRRRAKWFAEFSNSAVDVTTDPQA